MADRHMGAKLGHVEGRSGRSVAGISVMVAALIGLTSCTPPGPPGNITGIERVVYLPPPGAGGDRAAEAREQARLIQDRPQQFRVTGTGVCQRLKVDFGDGTSTVLWNGNLEWDGSLGTGALVGHTYASGPGQWRGQKRVTATPLGNCTGSASVDVTVLPVEMRFAFGQPGAICGVIGTVRAGTVLNTAPIKNPEDKIRFSAFETRGIAGAPDPALGPPFLFPFPGFRAYSLVYRVDGVGGQVGQGGTGVPFTADRTGTLEFCINDDLPSDNSGAWGILLTVDERNAN